MRVRERWRRAWCSGAAALVALGLSAALAENAVAAEHIKIGAVRSFGAGPSVVGKEKGFFAAEGLDAEIVLFESAQPIAVAAASGDIDFGASGMTAAFFNLAAQGALKIIGAGTWEHPGFQSIGILVSNQAYAAGLKSFADMGGHSIAITQLGTPLQYYSLKVAEKYHVAPGSLRFLGLQSNGVVASALAGGQADLAVQTAAPAGAIIEKGDGRLLGWTADELPPRLGEAVFTATKTANERPETVKHFINALRAAEGYFHDAVVDANDRRHDGANAGEVVAITAKYLGLSDAVLRRGMPYFDPQSRVASDDIDALMAWYKAQNMLKGPVDAAAIVDHRYAMEMPK